MTIRVPSITYDGEEYLLGDEYTAWSWINITSNQISNTWVTSFNGNTWAVTVTSDVTVSSQTGNVLTSWMSIWAGTQSDYENLGTYNSNCLYLTIE